MKNKKAQDAMFIIIAIVIVFAIITFFLIKNNIEVTGAESADPKNIVEKCVNDAVEASVEKMLANAGEVRPSQAVSYKSEEWNYLCYQADFYQGCYNLHPMLELQIEKEIARDTQDEIQECFNTMKADFENRGFGVGGGATEYSIDLLPQKVQINLNKKINIDKNGQTQRFEDFDTFVPSSIYQLTEIAHEIVNAESQYCYFDYSAYTMLYPQYDIRRFDYSDNKMYRLIDRRTGEEFKFATRSCVFAPGLR